MSTAAETRGPRRAAVMRSEERVTPLELFFDLVFVLAITQCTALMADNPTWEGIAQGLLVLGILWWAWGGYAWLTSVLDPEEGVVRFAIFAAMAALLVAALAIPEVFGDLDVLFVAAYAVVRVAHIVLFIVASRDDPEFRRAVLGLAVGTAVGITLLLVGALADSDWQLGIWAVALSLDMIEPFFFAPEGWRLAPSHFAERHGLILLIALGESIVAIGVGAEGAVDAGVVAAAVLGVAVAAAIWWLYFDVVSLVAERRLANAAEGRERNEIARDSYSYLHLPMVAGIVLLALGLKKTLGHVDDPLKTVPAAALFGGVSLYLLAHVGFRLRNIRTLNRQRLFCAVVLLCLIPLVVELPALGSVALLAVLLWVLIAYERIRFADTRNRLRQQLLHDHAG